MFSFYCILKKTEKVLDVNLILYNEDLYGSK